jgi:hypothetical protein
VSAVGVGGGADVDSGTGSVGVRPDVDDGAGAGGVGVSGGGGVDAGDVGVSVPTGVWVSVQLPVQISGSTETGSDHSSTPTLPELLTKKTWSPTGMNESEAVCPGYESLRSGFGPGR